MQSIERYGVIALLFLVVTVVAVLMWDTEEGPETGRSKRAEVAASQPRSERPVTRTTPQPRSEPRTKRITRARTEDRPLLRDGKWGEPSSSDNLPPAAALDEQPLAVRLPDAGTPVEATSGQRRTAEKPVERRETPPQEQRPTTSKRDRIYVVRPGDTLGEIALGQLGTSKLWPQIVELNPGLDPARMKVGARLVLPAAAVAQAPDQGTPAAVKAAPTAVADGYRVQSGDSLWRIAASELGDGERWREILAVNPGLDANRLNVGVVLRMPEGVTVERTAGETVAKAKPASRKEKGRVR